MGTGPHGPRLKSFVIAASIQRLIELQKGGPPKRIPVIICVRESTEQPESDAQASKDKIKEFLAQRGTTSTGDRFLPFLTFSP